MLIKIGDLYINQDHIVDIEDGVSGVVIRLDVCVEDDLYYHFFSDEQRQAFLDWLEYKAEVSVVF